MFSIYDGRSKFYQWDKDRKLIVEDKTITQVHFANCFCPNARVCEVYDWIIGMNTPVRVADVPNELLTEDLDIRVWGYDGGMTKHEQVFEVERRVKPADYIYTQTECWTAEKAVEEALEEAKANGDFKGDKGDKGDAGVINFVVVSELPATGSGDSIYLLPNATGEDNNFDEYIWQNGAWEKIGSAGVEVNLDEYVKNTDIVGLKKAGIVKVDSAYGIYATADGTLYAVSPNEQQIDSRAGYGGIGVNRLDYAIKSGLTKNTLEWTDEEKAKARTQLGAYAKPTVGGNYLVSSNKIMGLDKDGNEVSFKLDMVNSSYSIPIREGSYQLTVGTPTTAWHATTKKYVDDNFVAKQTSDRTSVYAVNSSGEQILVGTSPNAANNGMIPIYNKNGTINVGTPETSQQSVNKAYVDGLIADIESNIFVANPDTTWQEIDDAYSAGKYIFYAVDSWGIMNLIPLCQRGTGDVYIFTHIRENKYLYTVKVNKDNTRGVGSVYVVDKYDFDALVARVEALEGK